MLELHEVRKVFGPPAPSPRRVVAVDGISLAVRPGEVFGLLGPNGAGKSTTIAMAVGLLAPDSGRVTIGGEIGRAGGDGGGGSPLDPVARRGIGVAPQSLAIYDELTGRENLEFFGKLHGLGGGELARRVDETLEWVGLRDRALHRAGTYSGGMKRRLNLAAALVHRPRLVLLDEPTAGVDPQSRNNILDMVRRLAEAGTTVVYTTHYMEEAEKLCDRVGIVDKGRLLALGTVEELVATHGGDSVVRVRRKGADDVETIRTATPVTELQRVMNDGGGNARGIASVAIDRPDLESVFLALTGRSLRD